MQESEFDKFAQEYKATHQRNTSAFGEPVEYFTRQKIEWMHQHLDRVGTVVNDALDFGCGVGAAYPVFKDVFDRAELRGVDVSRKSLDIAEQHAPGQDMFHWFDGKTLPFESASFDIAFASCVFHHIEPAARRELVVEILRVLRPDGQLFVFEHNPLNPLTRYAVNTCPFDENASLLGSGLARRLLCSAGFDRVESHYTLFFPKPLALFRRFENALAWCPIGAQYVAVGAKNCSAAGAGQRSG